MSGKEYAVVNVHGDVIPVSAQTPADAWQTAETFNGGDNAPFTVVELVPVPRPVGPRPTATFGLAEGWHYRGGLLRNGNGAAARIAMGDYISIAADLWQRHQQWLADGGQDDA